MNKLPEEIEREIYRMKHQMEWFLVMQELGRGIAFYGAYRQELWEMANNGNSLVRVKFPVPFIIFLKYGAGIEYTVTYLNFLRYGFDVSPLVPYQYTDEYIFSHLEEMQMRGVGFVGSGRC